MSLVPNNFTVTCNTNENTIEFVNIKQEAPEYDECDVRIKIEPVEDIDESTEADNSCHNNLTVYNPSAVCSAELSVREEPLDFSVNSNAVPKSDENIEEQTHKSETSKKPGKSKKSLPRNDSEEIPHICTYCKKTFTFAGNLKKHIDKRFCKVLSPITCTICFKNFESIYLLKSHLRRHTPDQPFACDLCETKFKQKCALVLHMKIHNGVTPHKCQFCNKSFTHKTLLKAHTRIHTGERPFQCTLCPKNFTHKHNMQRHINNHKKVKKLTCDVCNKKFPRPSRLKYHMKVHLNEKHFPCFVCPKRFSNRQNVMRHYQKKHPDATYDCTDTDASVAAKVWAELESNVRQIDKPVIKNIKIPVANTEILKPTDLPQNDVNTEKTPDFVENPNFVEVKVEVDAEILKTKPDIPLKDVRIKEEPAFNENTKLVEVKIEPITDENAEENLEYILPE